MIRHDFRWLIVFACNLLLLALGRMANDALARFSFLHWDYCTLHLHLGGLLVTYAGLRLDARHGWICTLLTGLAVDAFGPLPFGTSMILFGLVQAVLVHGRQRFPREETVFALVVALLANLFLFLALSFFQVGDQPRPGLTWLRLFTDLLASQFVLLVLTGWFMALQNAVFARLGQHPETGRRVAL